MGDVGLDGGVDGAAQANVRAGELRRVSSSLEVKSHRLLLCASRVAVSFVVASPSSAQVKSEVMRRGNGKTYSIARLDEALRVD